jgi:hypothetical protein
MAKDGERVKTKYRSVMPMAQWFVWLVAKDGEGRRSGVLVEPGGVEPPTS